MSRPRRSLVAGNWKMYGSRAANAALLQGVRAAVPAGVEADRMNGKVPLPVGLPLTTPVVASRVRPAGSAPTVIS